MWRRQLVPVSVAAILAIGSSTRAARAAGPGAGGRSSGDEPPSRPAGRAGAAARPAGEPRSPEDKVSRERPGQGRETASSSARALGPKDRSPGRPSALRLTLAKALALAKRHNFQVRAARKRVAATALRVKSAYGALGPHLSASAGFQFLGGDTAFGGGGEGGDQQGILPCDDPMDPACATQMAELFCGTADTNDPCVQFLMTSEGQNTARMIGTTLGNVFSGFSEIGRIFNSDSFRANVTAVWPLFNAQVHVGIRSAKQGLRIAKLQEASTLQDVLFNVTVAFYQALQLSEMAELARKAMVSTKAHLRQARALVAAGSGTRTDVLRWEAQLEQNRLDWLKARLGVTQLKMLLNNLLGRPIRAPLELVAPPEVTGSLPEPEGLTPRVVLREHPQIKVLRGLERLKQLEVRSAQAKFLPSLNLQAQYSWARYIENTDVVPDSWLGSWVVGVQLTVPLFDSLTDYYTVRAKRMELEEQRLQRRNVERAVVHQFLAAKQDLESARAQVRAAAKQVELAEAAHHNAELLYQAGSAKTTDLLDAQLRAIQARANLIRVRYQYLIALARLKKAAGRLGR